MPNRTLRIPPDSPLHQKLVARLRSRINLAEREQQTQHDTWRRAEELTLAFMPETGVDAAKRAERERGQPRYTTIMVPYTFAMLLSAHTYHTSVFFARSPVHQFTGRHGEGEMQVQALDALIAYQVDVGEFLGPYYLWLYDIDKYGVGVLGEYWDSEKIHYGQIFEDVDPLTGQTRIIQATQEVIGYTGNKVYNVSPYDFLPDPRVPVNRFQQGEFVFLRKRLMWPEIEARRDAGYYMNTDQLDGHLTDKGHSLGSSELARPQADLRILEDIDARGNVTKKKSAGVFYEGYVKLSPSDWGLGPTTYPQIWCLTITEDLELIVGATPLGYMHGRFPMAVGEAEIEGYGTWGRGIPEINEPLQNTMDWLLNSHFYNVRAALNNQFIIDPSKIVIKDAANAGPGFVWRLRPEAYGTDISKMFMQVNVADVTRSHIADIQLVQGMAERALGINDQIMGVLNTQSRKTATEVRTTTGFGVNRQKTITEYLSATAFGPHAQRLVQNSQQYYDASMKLKRVGSLIVDAGQDFLSVNPEAIAGFYNFVPVDGTLPVDRMAQANLWKEIMGSVRMLPPQVAMEYDWSKIFAWVATLGGLKNIRNFKVQVVPNEVLAAEADRGNVVPMSAPSRPAPLRNPAITPGNAASTAAGLAALGGEGGPGISPTY